MKTYLVGGAIRDQLIGFPFHEKDWVVVGSSPEEMLRLGYTPVGKDFPVFLHPKTHEEYALARTERKTAPGYKGFTFHTDNNVSLEDDLERRDLTINAIAQDNQGNFIDPYNGQLDIQKKNLRHVSPAFSEDPVRVLRVARFAARFHHLGFQVAPETTTLIQAMVAQGETQHLVAERIWQECHKALQEADPDIFFSVLVTCQAIDSIFPHIKNTIGDCTSLLKKTQQLSKDSLLRFCGLCFPLDEETILSFCEYLNTPNEFKELALLSKQFYGDIEKSQWTEKNIARLFQKTDALRKPERFKQLLTFWTILLNVKNKTKIDLWLLEALEHYKKVDHQALIQQGYQKSALGEAIKEQRLIQLKEWLNHQPTP